MISRINKLNMSKKVFSSPLRHKEEGHMILTKEAHIKVHGGNATVAGYEGEDKTIDPEIKSDSKEDFYDEVDSKYIPSGDYLQPYLHRETHVLVGGCTDPKANNYDPNADIDDGSCWIQPSIGLPSDEKEKKQSTQNIISSIEDTPAGTVLGGVFTDQNDYQTNYSQIVDFFDRTEEQIQPALSNILGDGYTVKQTDSYLGKSNLSGIASHDDVVRITHDATGKEVYINVGISSAGVGDRYDQTTEKGRKNALEKGIFTNEFNKLSDFINSTATPKDELVFSKEIEKMVSKYAALNSTDGSYTKEIPIGETRPGAQEVIIRSNDFKMDESGKIVSGTESRVYYGPLAITPKEEKNIVKEIDNIDFSQKTSKVRVGVYDKFSEPVYRTVTEVPYEKERKIAERQLRRAGVESPTEEAIIAQTKENLVKEKLKDLKDQKATDFFNRDDIEETDLGSILNVGKIYHKRIDIEEKKKLGKIELEKQNLLHDLEAARSMEGTDIHAYYHLVDANNASFGEFGGSVYTFDIPTETIKTTQGGFGMMDISIDGESITDPRTGIWQHKNVVEVEGDHYVLENGTKVPVDFYNKAMLGKVELEKTYADLLNIDLKYLEQVEKVKEDAVRADLVSRNYNDWDKWASTVYRQTESIMFNIEYALGGNTDEEMLEFKKSAIDQRDKFQKDIKFENAFSSLDNFGRFLNQETATQLPIFTMIATGWPGIIGLGTSSFGEQWGRMVEADLDPLGPKTSTLNKFLTSFGYGAAEVVFDRFLTYPVLKRSGQAMFGNNYADLLQLSTKEYFKTYGKRQLLYDPLLEMSSEGLTTVSQNIITGRPITENLSHAMFSGGMFGTGFGHVPFYKGLVMRQFASPDMMKDYRSNINSLKELENSLVKLNSTLKANTTKGNNTTNIEGNIETVKQEQSRLLKENETIIEAEEKKVSNLTKKFFDTYNSLTVQQQRITMEAQRINSSEDLSGKEKQQILGALLTKFNDIQAKRDYLRDEKNFGKKFAGFKSSTDKKDIERKDKIYKDAENQLISEDKTEPKEKEIEKRAEIIYNTQEINNDFNKLKYFRKLDDSFQNFQTVEEAIKFINAREDLSDSDKAKLIKNLEEGGHGSNVETTVGDIFSFQVVENMAKDNRLETETHERGHYIFRMAFGENPGSFDGIAEVVLDYVSRTNEKLLTVLETRVERYGEGDIIPEGKKIGDMKSEELLMNFLELVAEEKIDLKSKKNKGLGAYFSWMINSSTKDALGENADLNFKGEDDAINFLITLGKKIKAGTITKEDIQDIKESKIAEIVGKENIENTSKKTTDADIKMSKDISIDNLSEVQEDATVDGKFNKDNFDPSDRKIMNELPGMVNAQISNLSINPFLTDNGRQELMMETISGLLNKKDINKFDGRGTLYGFTNGRIRYRILDAFKNNPAIVEDFSQVDLDETMKQLEAEAIDTTPLDETLTDETIVSDAKINVLALTNKADDIVKVVNPDGDYKAVTDNNIGKVGNIIFNIPTNKISDPKANITTSTKIIDANTGDVISKKDLKAGKKGILSPSEAKNIQDYFTPIETTKKFIKILPKENVAKKDADINKLGENIDVSRDVYGRAIGLPNRILKYFYQPKIENGKRVRSQGKTSQVGIWELKPEFSNLSETELTEAAKQFQQDLGITEDGLTNVLPTKENRSKIGQLLKGAAVVISQQASLSAAQRIKEAQLKKTKEADAITKVKQEIADITTGQADISFSKKAEDIIEKIFLDVEYASGRRAVDGLLNHYDQASTMVINNEEDIDNYIEKMVTDVFPILPKECFFSKGTGTALDSSSKQFSGINKKLWSKFQQKIKALKDQDEIVIDGKKIPIKFGDNIDGVENSEIWKLRSFYNNLSNPDKIEKLIKEGKIEEFNNKVAKIHRAFWSRTHGIVGKNKSKATAIASYLRIVASDRFHWHKLGAQIEGYSINPKGKTKQVKQKDGSYKTVTTLFELEHAMPATAAYIYLLDNALSGAKFDVHYNAVINNFKLIALDSAENSKLNSAKLGTSMLPGWNLRDNFWWQRYFNNVVTNFNNGIDPRLIIGVNGKTFAENFNINSAGGPRGTNINIEARIKNSKAISNARLTNKDTEARGITVLDFDDTLATTKSKVLWTAPDGTTGSLNAEEYASTYQDLAEQGYKFDFSEFNKVVDGKPAPLLNKAKKLAGKFGTKNMFILTARPQQSAAAIQVFLKENGLDIPLKNITGLGNSTSEAKALWMADKVADGYNDFYFADDALQNVQAVKNMLNQFDIKSKVQQAKIQFSKNLDTTFNEILEDAVGVKAEAKYSDAQAKLRGKGFKFRGLVPPSAQDFAGLLYNFIGKGKKGEQQFETLKKALIDPFGRGINELNTARQKSSEDYRNLLKEFPEIKKMLNKKVADSGFTVDQAIRVYLWNKAGFEIPGLSARDLNTLDSFVKEDSETQAFADGLGLVSKKTEGYTKPGEYWLVENIASDLMSDGAIGDARAEFLAEWQQNADQIFGKMVNGKLTGDNINKIEAIYVSKFREALEDVLYRMETGRNRPTGSNRLQNAYMNWVNNSVGAIMFFNIRSAVLQTISATNYINWSDNNPLKAGLAFANQKQFWSDFSMIFNSDYLKQRRSGNRRGINEAELSAAVANSDNKVKAALSWLLTKGFLPTQIADSFAIASGGAAFYRNRVKSYVKQGMSKTEAETQAFLDFQETTEVSQQSARPDLISQQQANPLGRLILSFQNTPMQYGRIMNKAFRDIANGRGDTKTHVSKIVYYGAIQGIIFTALQSALFAVIGSDDDDEKKEMVDKKTERMANSMIDTWFTAFGYGGKAISTIKNTVMEFNKQRDKDLDESFMTKSDHAYTLLQALGFSPPIGSKLRKIYQSIQTEKFNREVMKQRGFTLDNPIWPAIGNVVEGVTNVPLGRLSNKLLNLDNATDSNNETWQRIALILGWNTWDLGIKDPDLVSLGSDIKERKKQEKKMESEKKKFEKKRTKLKEKYPDKTEKEIEVIVKSKELFSLSKQTQIDVLKSLDVSDKDIKKLKKEKDRTDYIANKYKDNSELIDKTIKESKSKPKPKKKEKVKLSKSEQYKKSLFKMKKQDQINRLMELGYPTRKIYSLAYEKDRVEMIIKLESRKSK